MQSTNQEVASITEQIANSFAQQLDAHLGYFLKKNMIPFNGNIERTMNELKSRGMRLISEREDNTTTYMLVKIIDTTSYTTSMKFDTELSNKKKEQ